MRAEIATDVPTVSKALLNAKNIEVSETSATKKMRRATRPKISDHDRERLLEKRAELKKRIGRNKIEVSEASATKKTRHTTRYKMSDRDREALLEKRAELKKKIGAMEESIRAEQIKIIRAACEEHFAILTRKLRASQFYNDYKILVADGTPLECKRFLFDLRLNYDRLSDEEAIEIILNTVAEIKSRQSTERQDLSEYPQDGIDFEHWCADVLISFGWEATVSQTSGDQGVDILATRGSIILAVQCKRYGNPVGNKAVQEAFAGKQHVNATHACVIATSGFTKSAKELAITTGVLLVAPEDIPCLDQLL